jgi:rubrerythrin
MLDEARKLESQDGDFVEFARAGMQAAGEYHCSTCGYGVTIHSLLPQCPMCAGTMWEQTVWSPFSRATKLQ